MRHGQLCLTPSQNWILPYPVWHCILQNREKPFPGSQSDIRKCMLVSASSELAPQKGTMPVICPETTHKYLAVLVAVETPKFNVYLELKPDFQQ